jgi:hypothetical protein
MASWIRFFTHSSPAQSQGDIEEDDLFPALLAEAHPLPPATAGSHGNISRLPVALRHPAVSPDALRQERVA